MTAAGSDGQQRRRHQHATVADLDRCIHGRHVADDCVYCRELGHPNLGNPCIDNVVGYALGGTPFTVRDLLATVGRTGERES